MPGDCRVNPGKTRKSRMQQRRSWSHGGAFSRRPLGREIGVGGVSNKDGGAKKTQDYSDNFNHYDAPFILLRLTADSGFMPASSGPENSFG
jgi:hypothetical protein